MFLEDLKQTIAQNKDENPLFLRSLLKETVLYYILNFISRSKWSEEFLFKGGTCLRFFFDLPRLSEDLDFDIINYVNFNANGFVAELKSYFNKTLQFQNVKLRLANNERTIYLKFPILHDLGFDVKKGESNIFFVRIDFAAAVGKEYKTEISIKSTHNFSLLIKRYSIADLFSGKISAILTRQAFEGKTLKERFKGRDYYDLLWFLEKKIKPNWAYLKELTKLSKNEILKKIDEKVNELKLTVLESDLLPFFEDVNFVKNFVKNFKNLFESYKSRLEN